MMLPENTPVAIHFGALETRMLQLHGNRRGWSVRAAACYPAQGKTRHALAAEAAAAEAKELRWRGRDAVLGMGGSSVEFNLVPIDAENRGRQEAVLQQAAMSALEDEEGVVYRWLPMGARAGLDREELLLLTSGRSEVRRATNAIETLGLRPVSLEPGVFGLARALLSMRDHDPAPWGFLHLGYDRSSFGILHEAEVRFLKPMQLDGAALLASLHGAVERLARDLRQGNKAAAEADPFRMLAEAGFDADVAGPGPAGQRGSRLELEVELGILPSLHEAALEHALLLLEAVQGQAAQLAEEVRACLRHFHSRHKGARLRGISLSGFGASLPEVETALSKALDLPISLARPFSELGIQAPPQVLDDEHLWAPALGLAMRGFE